MNSTFNIHQENSKNTNIIQSKNKKSAPISIITGSDSIFIKGKLNDVATSYFKTSQKIQNLYKEKNSIGKTETSKNNSKSKNNIYTNNTLNISIKNSNYENKKKQIKVNNLNDKLNSFHLKPNNNLNSTLNVNQKNQNHTIIVKDEIISYKSNKKNINNLSKENNKNNKSLRQIRQNIKKTISKIVNGYNKLATAHHANDLAETMLLFLARGTGIKGLNPIKYKNGNVIRPLLSVSKQDILAFLEEEGIKHCEDLTNSDNDYTRNYIRNEIVPRLEEVNDKAVEHMVRTADIVSEAYDIIEDELNRLEETYIRRENNEYTVCLETKLLKPYMFKSLIHRAIAKAAQAEKDITAAHIEAVASLMDKQVGKMVDLPYNLKARREYDGILIKSADSYGVYGNEHAITYKTRAFIRQDGLNIPEKELFNFD